MFLELRTPGQRFNNVVAPRLAMFCCFFTCGRMLVGARSGTGS